MSVRAPHYYKGKLCSNLTEKDVNTLNEILDLQKKQGSIPKFKNIIFDLPDEEVENLAKDKNYEVQNKVIGELKDYQTLAVAFMYTSKNCLLGDSVGLGKTIEVSALMNLGRLQAKKQGRSFRYVYLTEVGVLAQTANEVRRFTAQPINEVFGDKQFVSAFVTENKPDSNFSNGIVGAHSLIKNNLFHTWIREATKEQKFDYLIIDESKVIASTKTQMRKMADILKEYFEHVILMNATPFESDLQSMYSQLDFLDKNLMPSYISFCRKFINFNPSTRRYDGLKGYKQPDVFRYEVSLFYFANTRKELSATYENCEVSVEDISLTNVQKSLLKDTSMNRMVFDCPTILDSSIPFTEQFVSKLSLLRGTLDDLWGEDGDYISGNPVVLFTFYKETIQHLKSYLEDNYNARVAVITGDVTKGEERKQILKDFASGHYSILISTVYRGLNIGFADTVIFYTFPSSAGRILQSEGRITRTMHLKDKNFHIYVTKGKEKESLKKATKSLKDSREHTKEELSLITQALVGDMYL